MSQLAKPRVLLDGLAIGESPRWHDGRLWLCNWGVGEIVAVGLDGSSEVVGRGRTLWAGASVGSPTAGCSSPARSWPRSPTARVSHAELDHISPYGWNEITVDGRGNVYVNTINFDFAASTTRSPPARQRKIALVTPDGDVREVASEIAFERDGRHARQHDVDRCGVVRPTAHRVRHRSRRQPVEPPDVGRTGRAGRHLSRCRRLCLGVVGRHDHRLRAHPRGW